ncbi:MAG TPA: hypothetical protein VIA09_00705 [Nitrososphaeraceae archaeon]|jgi:hypothetical protein
MKKSKSPSYDPQWKEDLLWRTYSPKQKMRFLIKELDRLHLEIVNRRNGSSENKDTKQEN